MPLENVLRQAARELKFEGRLEQASVYRLWQDAVGDAVARNASPATVRGGVLQVNVSSSVWVQQLHFLRGMLLDKINAGLSGAKIRDIRFKVGPVAPQEPARHHGGAPPPLTRSEEQAAKAAAAAIGDPELREAFQKFMTGYLQSRKQSD